MIAAAYLFMNPKNKNQIMSIKETEIFSLKGKVIVVTGATGVLGLSFINAIANAGGIVGVLGRKEKVANERVAEIIKNGGEAIALIADVMNEEQLIAAKNKVIEKYGKIDGLVNGAGGNVPESIVQPDQDVFSLQLDGMKKAMEVNLWGTVSPTLIFGKAIAENGGGSIVNISSVSAERTLTKVLGYSLGKAAVDSFTKWFAVEMAKRHEDKIRMNAIMPGFFLTEQNRTLLTDGKGGYSERGGSVIKHTPFNRFGDPKDLDGALVWLLSDASKFVTGTKVTVDGGFNAFCGV
jgi:NAD(P)-dependent dehydrogenase (short-subunit alcohol dehydrogenase family)